MCWRGTLCQLPSHILASFTVDVQRLISDCNLEVPPPPRTLVPICHMPSKVESAMPKCHYATCHSCQHAMCHNMCRAGSCCHLSSSFPGISFHCCCHRPPNIELQRRPKLVCEPHKCYRKRICCCIQPTRPRVQKMVPTRPVSIRRHPPIPEGRRNL